MKFQVEGITSRGEGKNAGFLSPMHYNVKAASIATGISESSLRTWERRYGIPSPSRSKSGHRTYDDADISAIRRMAALVAVGIPAAAAAEAVRLSAVEIHDDAKTRAEEHAYVESFVRGTYAYDEEVIRNVVRNSVASLNWPGALDEVILPAISRLSSEWEVADLNSAQLQFSAEIVRREISSEFQKCSVSSSSSPTCLLARVDSEQEDVTLLGLALLLNSEQIRTVSIGSNVPRSDLLSAIDALRPDAVCLLATQSSQCSRLTRMAHSIVRHKNKVRLFVGGSSTQGDHRLPPGIILPERLGEATQLIVAGLGTSIRRIDTTQLRPLELA